MQSTRTIKHTQQQQQDHHSNNLIKFFIYLSAELRSQWLITKSGGIQTTSAIRQRGQTNKNKRNNKNQENWPAKALHTQI
jgi:hypothetical protein